MSKAFGAKWAVLATVALVVATGQVRAADEAGLDGKAAFAKMKDLAGKWSGKAEDDRFTYRVISRGNSVIETIYPGTDNEMITVYYLDGNELVATHYCSHGNQPRFKLNNKASTPSRLVFDFAGGTNLDPAKDMHLHAMCFALTDKDHMTVDRDGYEDGKKTVAQKLELTRSAPAK